MSDYITIKEAAEFSNVTTKTINAHLNNGTIDGIQDVISRRWRVDPVSLNEYYYPTIEGENQHNIINRGKKDSFARKNDMINSEMVTLYNTFRSFEWKNKNVEDVCDYISGLIS